VNAGHRDFTHPGLTKESCRPRRFQVQEFEIIGSVVRIRDSALLEAGVNLQIVKVLGQAHAHTLDDATVVLTIDGNPVDNRTDVNSRSNP